MTFNIKFQSSVSDQDRMDIPVHDFEIGQRNDQEYQKMLLCTSKSMKDVDKKPSLILEFGAGTGLFSEVYVPQFIDSRVVITEPDKYLLEEIPKKLKFYSNVEYVQSLAQSFNWPEHFDIIVGTEAYHHVPDKEKQALFDNFISLLNPEGILIIGDNFIPQYNTSDPKDRIRALHDFWGPYIKAKEEAGDKEGVKTFTYALRQAESGVMEYKTSLEVFEKYATNAGFAILKKEELSEGINFKGGYCVYILKLKAVN